MLTTTVATVLDEQDRSRLEAAAGDHVSALHAHSVYEALHAVRRHRIDAVLLSPREVPPDDLAGVERLVREFPGIPTVAIVSRLDARSSQRLLQLGASGVQHLLHLGVREGCVELRKLLSHDWSPAHTRILRQLVPVLDACTPSVVRFFERTVHLAPDTPTVRLLTTRLEVPSSTFMSRFFRAELPSPKSYLSAIRLLHAAALFETPGFSISDVAHRLEYSSPQSFGRHVRAVTGLTAGEFRSRYVFEIAARDFVRRLILPFQATFRTFEPL